MGGGKGDKGDYYKFYLSLHIGVASKLDEVTQIIVGDREIWSGSVTQSMTFNVDNEGLFGGKTKEGGVKGGITVLMGEQHQQLPYFLLAKFPDITDRVPGYRNMTTVFFHEPVASRFDGALIADIDESSGDDVLAATGSNDGGLFGGVPTDGGGLIAAIVGAIQNAQGNVSSGSGFYWQANNPYMKKIKVLGRRFPRGLSMLKAKIPRPNGVGYDVNPAHVIFELMTNRDFGSGMSISRVNVESFEIAADTLFHENFGVSLKWANQSKVKDMILEMLDHINGLIYENPKTGLSELKLLRDDYDPNNLPIADYSNCEIKTFQRKQEELVNSVTVTYTDPESYEEATVTVQDLASIAAEQNSVPTSRNYYAVHRADLAEQLGERDLRAESYPLAMAEVDFFREFWELTPGMVVRLISPDDTDEEIVARIMSVDDAASSSGSIRASVVQDVFALDSAPITGPTGPIITYPDGEVSEADQVEGMTMPYLFSVQSGLIEAGSANYPEAHLAVLAADNAEGVDFFEIVAPVTDTLGNESFGLVGTGTMLPFGRLREAIVPEVSTVIPPVGLRTRPAPEVGDFAVIGTGGDGSMELAVVTAVNGTDGYTLMRGVLDTVPAAWPENTPIWFVSSDNSFWDNTDRAVGETVEYKVLPVGIGGSLEIDEALPRQFTLSDRAHAPYRPANVKVMGTGFGTAVLNSREGVEVTWAPRYRRGEDARVMPWDGEPLVPEVGQRTEIAVLDATTRDVITWHYDLTGASYTLPESAFGTATEVIVKVYASRDEIRSIQGHEIRVQLPEPSGYGRAYGASWGA